MFEYIKGLFKGINKEYVIVENMGVGYKVFTSGTTMSRMPKVDEEVILYLVQIVRQDFVGLYGFYTEEERELFNKLLAINGVGAKAALSLLSIANVDTLKQSIVYGDEKMITRAPGIGKKTAQRIILELKDKLEVANTDDELDMSITGDIVSNRNIGEAIAALMSLGYSEKEAEKAVKAVDCNSSLEEIIKNCLKYLMNWGDIYGG